MKGHNRRTHTNLTKKMKSFRAQTNLSGRHGICSSRRRTPWEQIKFRMLPFIVNIGRAGKLIYFHAIFFLHINFSFSCSLTHSSTLLDISDLFGVIIFSIFFLFAVCLFGRSSSLFMGVVFWQSQFIGSSASTCLL